MFWVELFLILVFDWYRGKGEMWYCWKFFMFVCVILVGSCWLGGVGSVIMYVKVYYGFIVWFWWKSVCGFCGFC